MYIVYRNIIFYSVSLSIIIDLGEQSQIGFYYCHINEIVLFYKNRWAPIFYEFIQIPFPQN